MLLQSFHTPGLAINSYILGDANTHKAVVIDPTRDLTPYLQYALNEGLKITDIVETHVHADFVSGAKELKQQLLGKPFIHCSAMGGSEWIPHYADKQVQNGDTISLGSCRLQAIHTPGHTPEHLVWLGFDETKSLNVPCLAFTGDLLFVGSVGRPDLLGKTETKKLGEQLYHTLFSEVSHWPDFLEIFPGHGAGSLCGKGLSARPTSTLGYERLFNPYLQKRSEEEWIEEIQKGIPAAPINFKRIKTLNVQGSALNEQKGTAKILFIDTRHPDAFARSHLEGALNVPWGGSFCNWVSSILDEDVPLGIIVDNETILSEVKKSLALIGFDQIAKEVVWDANIPTCEILQTINVEELPGKPGFIVDVRTPAEWEAGHVQNAHWIQLANFAENLDQIPKDQTVFVMCGSGFRGSVVASFLKNHGFRDVSIIRGGMTAWYRAKLPVVKDG
jgi:hydroxyacylglutathione hydrolase